MKKKPLYLDLYRVQKELIELEKLQGYANDLFKLLLQFDVDDPEAIKNPIGSVEEQLKSSMPSGGLNIPLANILKLVDKAKEYQHLIRISRFVVGHKYIHFLTFRNNYFSIKPTAEQTITEAMTTFLTNPDQIKFANRIEKCIDFLYYASDILGINLGNTDLLRTFHASRTKDGKTILENWDNISRISARSVKPIK